MSHVQIHQKASEGFQAQGVVNEHAIGFDVSAVMGGGDTSPSPHDMLLASLGACTAITLRMYAKRKEWPLDDVQVTVAHSDHKATTPIEKTITLHGDLIDEQRERLLVIAEKCPVNQLIQQSVEVNSQLK
jgi:putative redox protein